MRVDVKKHLIYGPWSARDEFFRRIQKLGIVEFISSNGEMGETPSEIETYVSALHVLRRMVPVDQVKEIDTPSAIVLAREIVEKNGELEHLRERKRILQKEISRIEVFGSFSVADIEWLEHQGVWVQFYFSKRPELYEAPKREEVIEIGQAHELHYFAAINKKKTNYEGLVEIKIDQSLDELELTLSEVEKKIDEYETELARLAHHKHLLKEGLADAINRFNLIESKERVEAHLEGDLFAVEGWVPVNRIKELNDVADQLNVHAEPILVEPEDKMPTHLDNQGIGRIGEDLIGIYDIPSTSDRDPSRWVFYSFALFFSMIVADAGYGLVLLAISLFLLWKFGKKSELGKRIIKLSIALSIGCIIWGVLLVSFFGIEFPPDSKLGKLSIVNIMAEKRAAYVMNQKSTIYNAIIKQHPEAEQASSPSAFLLATKEVKKGKTEYPIYKDFTDTVLLELVLFLGTIHISLSFLRYADKNWSGIGWVIFLIGGYLYFPSIVKTISFANYLFGIPEPIAKQVGFYMIWIGLALAVVLALIQRRLKGLGEVMQVIQVFADVMSYLRIYALSLAGVIMAQTFNQVGTEIPLVIGIFIIIAGHLINFVLALMGGLIHGLRLNFIEWYHYSFEGGGRGFRPLSMLKLK